MLGWWNQMKDGLVLAPGKCYLDNHTQGSYTMSPKKFQDYSRTFKDLFFNFPGPKSHESTAGFHSNDKFRTMLRSVAQAGLVQVLEILESP